MIALQAWIRDQVLMGKSLNHDVEVDQFSVAKLSEYMALTSEEETRSQHGC